MRLHRFCLWSAERLRIWNSYSTNEFKQPNACSQGAQLPKDIYGLKRDSLSFFVQPCYTKTQKADRCSPEQNA